jgi:four helix bundle protein
MAKIASFKDLRVWNLGVEIVLGVYALTKEFPKEEIYGLASQIRRASVSIPANIAEGFRRFSSKEHKQFLRIAFGSVAELETELIIATRVGFIEQSQLAVLSEKIDHLSRMFSLFIKKFQ